MLQLYSACSGPGRAWEVLGRSAIFSQTLSLCGWIAVGLLFVLIVGCGEESNTKANSDAANSTADSQQGGVIGDAGDQDGQTSVTTTSGSVNCSQFFAEPDASVAMGMPFLNSQTFIPLKEGSTIVVQASNSGQMVFFVTLKGTGFATTGVSMEITVEIPATGVTGQLNTKAPSPKIGINDAYIWLDRGVALVSDTGQDLYSKNEIPLFDNQPATLTTRLFSPCGLDISQTLNVTMRWSSNIGAE